MPQGTTRPIEHHSLDAMHAALQIQSEADFQGKGVGITCAIRAHNALVKAG